VPVYQPNAIVGNSHVLVSIGARAELMTFLYPHIDFPQNLHEGMPAVYLPGSEGAAGRLCWTFEPTWESSQHYLGRTNILETHLRHTRTGLGLRIVDFVHPSEPMLLRRFEVTNPTGRPLRARLFQYLDLQLGEVEHRNAVHYHPDRHVAAAYWRNVCFAIGPDSPEEFGCGRATAGSTNSAKRQMEQGQLNKQMEEIGDIDLAVGWNLVLQSGDRVVRDLIIAADSSERAAVARVETARGLGWQSLYSQACERWERHVARARPVHIEPDLEEAYYRCLLGLDLLADAKTGSIVAAPEFDPFFERSGGYGYCWPRDAVEVCLALELAGYPEYLARFLAWARRAQRREGYWEQRYWLNGERGPAWCTGEDGLQIDQTASVLFAIGRHVRSLTAEERLGFLEQMWRSAHLAATYLTNSISGDNALHAVAFDLWETFRGSFTYSNAAISSALQEAAFLAREVGRTQLAEQWESTAAQVKRAVMSKLWQDDIFVRGLDSDGRLDRAADSAILGLVTPFRFLRLEDPSECQMVRTFVETLMRRAGENTSRGETLRRFEGDQYAGGGPSAVSTLWLARVLLSIALACQDDEATTGAYRARAVSAMRAVLEAGTSTGLLPEMMGPAPGSHWAVPHAWAMASFAMAAVSLDRLSTPVEARIPVDRRPQQ